MFIRLLITDIKRIFTLIPSILISMAIIGAVIFTAAFCSDRILYNEQDVQPIEVGIVMYISSDYSTAAYNMVANMDSYSSYCSIHEVADEDTGLEMLANGELTALIVVPDNILSDINNGINTPVKVIYEPDGTFESYLLNEIFVSTSSMLTISEAAIYTGTRLARDMELSDYLVDRINYDLNMLMIDYVLSRSEIFNTNQVYVTGTYSVTEYYMAAAIILITFLSGIVFMSFIKGNSDALTDRLHIYSVNNLQIFISRLISIFIYLCGISVLSCTAVYIISDITNTTMSGFTFKLLMGLLLTAFCASLFTVIIGSISGSHYTACLLLIFAILIFAYTGGLLVPEHLLPEAVRKVAAYTPLYKLNNLLCSLLYGR